MTTKAMSPRLMLATMLPARLRLKMLRVHAKRVSAEVMHVVTLGWLAVDGDVRRTMGHHLSLAYRHLPVLATASTGSASEKLARAHAALLLV
jgi:hypothetical protein